MAGGNNFLNWNAYQTNGIGTNGVPGQVSNASAFPRSTSSGWGSNVFSGAANPYATTASPFTSAATTTNAFSAPNTGTSSWGANVFTGATNPYATTNSSTSGMNPLLSMLGVGSPSVVASSPPSVGQQASAAVTGGMNSFLSMLGLGGTPSTAQSNTGTQYSNQLGWGNGIYNTPSTGNGPFSTMTNSNTGTSYSNQLGWGNGIYNAPGVGGNPFATMTQSNNTGTLYGNSLGGTTAGVDTSSVLGGTNQTPSIFSNTGTNTGTLYGNSLGGTTAGVDTSSVLGGASQSPNIFATLGATAMNNYQQYNSSYGVGGFLQSLFAAPAVTPAVTTDPNANQDPNTTQEDPNATPDDPNANPDDPNANPDDSSVSDEQATIQREAVIDPNNPNAVSQYTTGGGDESE
jgi:hypothetical protein